MEKTKIENIWHKTIQIPKFLFKVIRKVHPVLSGEFELTAPPPYFAKGEKNLVFLYKRPFFSIGKKVNGLIAPPPLIFSKNCRKGKQLTRIPLIEGIYQIL